MEIIQQQLDDLQHYMLTSEQKFVKLNSADRVILEDVHCLIRFFQHVCTCCVERQKLAS